MAIPTETVYGLAADAENGTAVARIFEAKGRPADNPLIVHIADWNMLSGLVSAVPETAEKLARPLAWTSDDDFFQRTACTG